MKRRLTCIVLALVMMFSVSVSASAAGYDVSDVPWVIYDDLEEMGTLPPVTLRVYYGDQNSFGNPNVIAPLGYGDGEVVARMDEWQTASTGVYRCGSKTGTYLSIASLALGFSGLAAAMTVSQILAVAGLTYDIVNNNTSVKAETYISFRYTYRDGVGRWSTEPDEDEYYFLGYRTGMRETFKHVMGGVLQSDNRWKTNTVDYPNAINVEKSPHYDDIDWIIQQGKINVILGQVYDETGW